MSKLPFMSDDHHVAIASVAVRAAQLDAHIELFVWVAMRTQANTCKFLLRNLNGDKHVDLAKNLLLDSAPKQQTAIEEIFSKIKELRNERNELLHWIWGKSEDETLASYAQIRPFRERKSKTKTAAGIQVIADDLLLIVGLLTAWMTYADQLRQPSLQGTLVQLVPPPNWASAKSEDRPVDAWLRTHLHTPFRA